jgi:hypothetical protein
MFSDDTIKRNNVGVLLNDTRAPVPLTMRAAVPHRLRFMMITVQNAVVVASVLHGDSALAWTRFAKDGYTLPVSQVRVEPARRLFSMGETFDAHVTVPAPGTYSVELRLPAPNSLLLRQDIRVVP